MEDKKFKRTIEDFTCGHCGAEMKGGGYTNHCSQCLWSRHVDVNPGDRAALCQGMMEPIESELRGKEYFVKQRCVICGHERWNSLVAGDDFDALVRVEAKRGR